MQNLAYERSHGVLTFYIFLGPPQARQRGVTALLTQVWVSSARARIVSPIFALWGENVWDGQMSPVAVEEQL